MKLKALIVDDIRSEAGKSAGAIEFRSLNDIVRGIACRCPCGCGSEMWLPVCLASSASEGGRTAWEWNGSQDRAVLTPSVFNTGLPCRWHGYLGREEPGYWDEC
jgi:hypothetical protein